MELLYPVLFIEKTKILKRRLIPGTEDLKNYLTSKGIVLINNDDINNSCPDKSKLYLNKKGTSFTFANYLKTGWMSDAWNDLEYKTIDIRLLDIDGYLLDLKRIRLKYPKKYIFNKTVIEVSIT